jgi:uncharacterized membrane protein (UPF0127 family)
MLANTTRSTVLAREVETAFTFMSRFKGLLGRSHLPEGHALILAPCRSVHMFFMRFALDVVFADREHMVVAIERGLKPWRISNTNPSAWYAIELPVGTVDRTDTQVGDSLKLSL